MPTRFAVGDKLKFTARVWPISRKAKDERKIGLRHIAGGLFRPLDQAHGIVTEIFTQACIFKFFWLIESIKIKVIPVYARNYVNFNQCVSRTLHRPDVAKRAKQPAA